MLRLVLVVLVFSAACGADKLPFEASGTITVDGQPRTATACSMSGTGADVIMSLTLDDKTVIALPVHSRSASIGSAELECSRGGGGGRGSDRYYSGTLERECDRLQMSLTVECGKPGPSNQKSDESDKR